MREIHGDPWVDPTVFSLVPRSEWGALPAKTDIDPLPLPIKNVAYSCNTEQLIVCKTKEACIPVVQQIQKKHMEEKGLPDIAYNFLIGDDGNVYEGRGWEKRPALYTEDPVKYDNTMDIAYIGISEAKYLHWDMYRCFEWLRELGVKQNYLVADLNEFDFCDKDEDFEGLEDLEEESLEKVENSTENPAAESPATENPA